MNSSADLLAGLFLIMEHRITSITAQKRNRNRVNVFLDGDYAFSLATSSQPGCEKSR